METKFDSMLRLFVIRMPQRTLCIRTQHILAYQYRQDIDRTKIWVAHIETPFELEGDHRKVLAEAMLYEHASHARSKY